MSYGSIPIDSCGGDWAGPIQGTDGSTWEIHFELDCDTWEILLVAASTDPRWTGGNWRTRPGTRYNGGRQLDTGWLPFDPPPAIANVIAVVKASL